MNATRPLDTSWSIARFQPPVCLPDGSVRSSLFHIPAEVRLLIYEFVFSSDAPFTSPPQCPSQNLKPLLTCRRLYEEAKLLAFACTIHSLNWARRLNFQRRLSVLTPAQRANIRHVSLNTSPSALYDRLQPLRFHIDHCRFPAVALDTLTIILELPEPPLMRRDKTIEEMNMVLAAIWYYKNVNKVIVLNIKHRERLKHFPQYEREGRWTCLGDPNVVARDDVRWRFELSTFFDYSLKPWDYMGCNATYQWQRPNTVANKQAKGVTVNANV